MTSFLWWLLMIHLRDWAGGGGGVPLAAKTGGRNRKAVSCTLWMGWSHEWDLQVDTVVSYV